MEKISMLNKFGGAFKAEPEKVDEYLKKGGRFIKGLEPIKAQEPKKKAIPNSNTTSTETEKSVKKI